MIHLESHIRLPVSRWDQNKRSYSALLPEPCDPSDPLTLIMYVAKRDAIWAFWQVLAGKIIVKTSRFLEQIFSDNYFHSDK